MGKKKKQQKKEQKKLKKAFKKEQKAVIKAMVPEGCKTKCCEKYKKSESKRCQHCPCFDFLKKVA